MPPKRSSVNKIDKQTGMDEKTANTSTKRKTTSEAKEPQKAARRSARSTPKSHPSQHQLLDFMLSEEAEELCRPEEESKDIKKRGNIRTYSGSVLNPFEELLCAVVLSRPISHRLGLRTIRTILNEPYNFASAKAVRDAGEQKVHEAVWEAKTQHKQKTADEIEQVAKVVMEKFTAGGEKEGTQLRKVLDDNGGDFDKALISLKDNIKGFGETGANIFSRRVQWIWAEGFPFVDDRTALALKKLSLPEEPEELRRLLDKHWSQFSTVDLAGEDEAAKKRRAFVIVLERAIGADLEGKIDSLLAAPGSTL